ncbi:hypothetical protein D3C76_885010 [compost metagenome]
MVVHHGDASACLACADELRATGIERGNHARRWRDIDRRDRADRRYVAAGVHQAHLQPFAIELRCIEVDHEGAVGGDRGGADLQGADEHAHGGAGFAGAAELVAAGVQVQLHCRCGRRQVRCIDRDRRTDVAGWIGLLHRQHLLVDLRWRQLDAEAAIGEHQGGAQDHAGGVGHGHGRPHLAATGDDAAVGVDQHIGEGGWRREVRGLQGGDGRHVAGGVGLADAQQLGIAQRRGEGNGEMAAGIDLRRANLDTGRVAHADQRPRLATAGQGNAIAGDRQLGRRGG